ncbi:MAG: hypothetical protein ACLFTV_07135 [Desulfococcaceae bacterium]
MGAIHFIGGGKGGVGKSVMARVLAQYHIDRKEPVVGFDTDRSHASFTRFYADYASPVLIDRFESLDAILEGFEEAPDPTAIVDLAAQSFAPVSQWILESDLFEAARELNVDVTLWHVMDDGRDSVQLLGKLLDTFGSRPDYVVVRNEGRGADFSAFEDSEEKARAKERDAKFMTLPRLHDATMRKIDRLNSSFWAAVNNKGRGNRALGILERQRVKTWLARSYAAVEDVVSR